jgi:hypothetical protein
MNGEQAFGGKCALNCYDYLALAANGLLTDRSNEL